MTVATWRSCGESWRWLKGKKMQRQVFEIDTDTGSQGDTGPPFHGAVLQMRWQSLTGDTGGDLQIALLPRDGDTGGGWQFASYVDALGEDFTKAPSQPIHGGNGAALGADTGTQAGVPIVAAGDRLRVKVNPGGAALAGRLYVWTAG